MKRKERKKKKKWKGRKGIKRRKKGNEEKEQKERKGGKGRRKREGRGEIKVRNRIPQLGHSLDASLAIETLKDQFVLSNELERISW